MHTSPCVKSTVIISLGDPFGIGPEVVVKSLKDRKIQHVANYIIVGDKSVVEYYNRSLGAGLIIHPLAPVRVSQPPKLKKRIYLFDAGIIRSFKNPARQKPSPKGGLAALSYLDHALELTRKITPSVLVTAPVCKESVEKYKRHFCGHTDYLGQKTHSKCAIMCFIGKKLKVALFTHHIPLSAVPGQIKRSELKIFLRVLIEEIKDKYLLKKPRIAIAGLNPHAGEGGILGREERDIITPAIKSIKEPLVGPVPADVLFYNAYRGDYDFVVALYHDQALAPFKMIYRRSGVNLTLGLPFIRTSPDHGTAFDIAGKNKADPRSFKEAIRLACRLAK